MKGDSILMKNLRLYAGCLILGSVSILSCWQFSYGQTPPCCTPPIKNFPLDPRFAVGSTINVYIDSMSGFFPDEMNQIKDGIEDWNDKPHNTQIQFVVSITSELPSPGTHKTITVTFVNQTGIAATSILTQGSNMFGHMFFRNYMRTTVTPALRPGFVRETARHEIGHVLGLNNADNCPYGSTIMQADFYVENFITA